MTNVVDIFASIKPSKVLYYFDEPLIFFTENTPIPLLCLKIDNGHRERQFLAVAAPSQTIDRLIAGTLSLRSAFTQTWCWIIRTRADFSVLEAKGLSGTEVSDDYLPEAGVGLYAHHGKVVDEFSRNIETTGFLTISFKGGELGVGTMPFSVFKGLVDGVYVSLRKIFSPVVKSITDEKMAESVIGKLLNVPVHPPKFASLTIAVDAPHIDTAGLKQIVSFDNEKITSQFNDAAEGFMKAASEIEQLADQDKLRTAFSNSSSIALEVMAQLSPNSEASFDTVEISGNMIQNIKGKIVVDARKGQRIHDAFNQNRKSSTNLTGKIVELNLRSGTFVLKADGGATNQPREVTCVVNSKALKAAMPVFGAGTKVDVTGNLERRTRRDRMRITSFKMPDGTVINE
jgi:hypothetical protein